MEIGGEKIVVGASAQTSNAPLPEGDYVFTIENGKYDGIKEYKGNPIYNFSLKVASGTHKNRYAREAGLFILDKDGKAPSARALSFLEAIGYANRSFKDVQEFLDSLPTLEQLEGVPIEATVEHIYYSTSLQKEVRQWHKNIEVDGVVYPSFDDLQERLPNFSEVFDRVSAVASWYKISDDFEGLADVPVAVGNPWGDDAI